MTRVLGIQVDHYELLEHLADGSQAEVYRASDTRSGEDVVIKFPHAAVLDHPVLAARWRREFDITEALAHPNIQRRLDVGERHHEPYLVLEYAGGGSLDRWISSDGPGLPVGQAVAWGRQLAGALAYLHHLGIIHRDLKPANILVTDDMDLKLADFGSATRAPRRSRWWHLLAPLEGTPDYLSPEQIVGYLGDERSDIYGWGVVMYQLLTGELPFSGPDPEGAMLAHLHLTVTPIRELRPDVPAALETVVLTALRRYPERRHQSALAIVDLLDNLDDVDAAAYDLSPEPPMPGQVGGSELAGLVRFSLVVAAAFLGIVAAIILLSVAIR